MEEKLLNFIPHILCVYHDVNKVLFWSTALAFNTILCQQLHFHTHQCYVQQGGPEIILQKYLEVHKLEGCGC